MSFLYFNMLQHFHCDTELCHIVVKGDYAAPLFCIGRVSLWKKDRVSMSITDEQSQLQSIAYTLILQTLRGSIRDTDPPNWRVADFAVESARIYCPFTTFCFETLQLLVQNRKVVPCESWLAPVEIAERKLACNMMFGWIAPPQKKSWNLRKASWKEETHLQTTIFGG